MSARALILILLCELTNQETFLFVVSSQQGHTPAGFYGATLGSKGEHSTIQPAYDFLYGYHCMTTNGVLELGLDLKSVAYDSISGHVLLVKKSEDSQVLSLYEGPVCHHGGCGDHSDCAKGICEWKGRQKRLKILFDEFRFGSSEPTPSSFAYHDGVIYFVSRQRRSVGLAQTRNIIQLRRISGCGDPYPVMRNSQFDIEACSEVLATLVDEQGVYASFEPMAGLRVVDLDQEKFAFLTLQQIMFSDVDSGAYEQVSVNLYGVSLDARSIPGDHHRLHQEVVGKDFRKYIMDQLGNIDYKDGKLCWSAVDRIICADFMVSGGRWTARHTRYALAPGDASGVVCTGQDKYSNVTTGVAISDVAHVVISLFFGCMAGVEGAGGSGFLRMHHYEFGNKARLQTFTNASSPLYSGQMFLTQSCQSERGNSPDPSHTPDNSGGQNEPHPDPSTQGAAIQRGYLTTIIVVFFVTLLSTNQINCS